jgi:hypothetical protein
VPGDEVRLELRGDIQIAPPQPVHADQQSAFLGVDGSQARVRGQPQKQHHGQQHRREQREVPWRPGLGHQCQRFRLKAVWWCQPCGLGVKWVKPWG